MEDDSLGHRRKNFAIEIKEQRYQREGADVSITHNGKQWNTINLLPKEMLKLRDALNEYMETVNA